MFQVLMILKEEDPLLWKTIAEVWEFAERTCPRRFPPGVHKHRSIEEARQLRERWEEANFAEYWSRQAAIDKPSS